MAIRLSIPSIGVARGAVQRLFCTSSSSSLPSFFPPISSNEGQSTTPGRVQNEPNPNLFVSGLSKRTTNEGLRKAFSEFGEVVSARVVTDRDSGYSKGFGFVKYATIDEAQKGIEGMDGKFLDGWVIFAEYARPRPSPPTMQNNMPSGYGSYNNSSYNN